MRSARSWIGNTSQRALTFGTSGIKGNIMDIKKRIKGVFTKKKAPQADYEYCTRRHRSSIAKRPDIPQEEEDFYLTAAGLTYAKLPDTPQEGYLTRDAGYLTRDGGKANLPGKEQADTYYGYLPIMPNLPDRPQVDTGNTQDKSTDTDQSSKEYACPKKDDSCPSRNYNPDCRGNRCCIKDDIYYNIGCRNGSPDSRDRRHINDDKSKNYVRYYNHSPDSRDDINYTRDYDRHYCRDDRHSSRDDRHSSRDDRHSSRDDRHYCRDDRHFSRDDRHSSRDERHSSRDDRHFCRDDRHCNIDDRHCHINDRHFCRADRHTSRADRHSSRECRYSNRDSINSSRDDSHYSRGDRHYSTGDRHYSRDSRHYSRADRHSNRDSMNSSREDSHFSRDDRHSSTECRHVKETNRYENKHRGDVKENNKEETENSKEEEKSEDEEYEIVDKENEHGEGHKYRESRKFQRLPVYENKEFMERVSLLGLYVSYAPRTFHPTSIPHNEIILGVSENTLDIPALQPDQKRISPVIVCMPREAALRRRITLLCQRIGSTAAQDCVIKVLHSATDLTEPTDWREGSDADCRVQNGRIILSISHFCLYTIIEEKVQATPHPKHIDISVYTRCKRRAGETSIEVTLQLSKRQTDGTSSPLGGTLVGHTVFSVINNRPITISIQPNHPGWISLNRVSQQILHEADILAISTSPVSRTFHLIWRGQTLGNTLDFNICMNQLQGHKAEIQIYEYLDERFPRDQVHGAGVTQRRCMTTDYTRPAAPSTTHPTEQEGPSAEEYTVKTLGRQS